MRDWLASSVTRPPASLPDSVMLAGREVPLHCTRHPMARRMTLRYDAQRRCVRLTLPPHAPLRLAQRFLQERMAWLAARCQQHPEAIALTDGITLPVLGEYLTLRHRETLRGRVEQHGQELLVPCPAPALPKRVEDWLKTRLRETIIAEATCMANALGVTFRRISLRDTTSRWGSCSSAGNLSFSWRLVFAPRSVLSYLIAHEVAHLREMNHSPAFWQLVAQLYPDYETAKRWLRDNAAELHRYGV